MKMETYKLFIVMNSRTLVFDDVEYLTIAVIQSWLDEVNILKPFVFKYHTQKYIINKNAVQYIKFEEMKSYEDRTHVWKK